MKNTFNQKFGPKNNSSLDQRVFQAIKNEKKHSLARWYAWGIGISVALSISFCTISLHNKTDHARESYVQSVLEVQKSFDENMDLENSSDANEFSKMETDET